ncbi:hypothetical protein [Amaricoccus solimangrovi]|uniref:Uncharacterized protein n=1 Tax=Amaricoccus solimangrovi TaxID=2589815 RepID=A0A501WK81_9RHOB|nr:hypothetical protein [Amaricoccus solimangrovi]TPE49758.1 hypothetical protein FJM51_14035 [Amaricoccus solimangrovi]
MRPIHLLSALLLIGAAARAEEAISPGPLGQDAETCADFVALDEGDRVGALTAIEPFGDDIGAEDEAAARDWADEVARQCEGHPDLSLTAAAAAANLSLGEDD